MSYTNGGQTIDKSMNGIIVFDTGGGVVIEGDTITAGTLDITDITVVNATVTGTADLNILNTTGSATISGTNNVIGSILNGGATTIETPNITLGSAWLGTQNINIGTNSSPSTSNVNIGHVNGVSNVNIAGSTSSIQSPTINVGGTTTTVINVGTLNTTNPTVIEIGRDAIDHTTTISSREAYLASPETYVTGYCDFTTNLPTSTVNTTTSGLEFLTRNLMDDRYAELNVGNAFTGLNTFNTLLPTSTISATSGNQFLTRTAGDARYAELDSGNAFTSTNSFSVLPTSTVGSTTGGTEFLTRDLNDARYPQLNTTANTVITQTIPAVAPSLRVPILTLQDVSGVDFGSINFLVNAKINNYNPIVEAGDAVIFSQPPAGTTATGLVITNYSSTGIEYGIRLTENMVTIKGATLDIYSVITQTFGSRTLLSSDKTYVDSAQGFFVETASEFTSTATFNSFLPTSTIVTLADASGNQLINQAIGNTKYGRLGFANAYTSTNSFNNFLPTSTIVTLADASGNQLINQAIGNTKYARLGFANNFTVMPTVGGTALITAVDVDTYYVPRSTISTIVISQNTPNPAPVPPPAPPSYRIPFLTLQDSTGSPKLNFLVKATGGGYNPIVQGSDCVIYTSPADTTSALVLTTQVSSTTVATGIRIASGSVTTIASAIDLSGNTVNITGTTINLTGTTVNISGAVSIPSTSTAVTQLPTDSSTKIATTAFVAQTEWETNPLEIYYNVGVGGGNGLINFKTMTFDPMLITNASFTDTQRTFLTAIRLNQGQTYTGMTVWTQTNPTVGSTLRLGLYNSVGVLMASTGTYTSVGTSGFHSLNFSSAYTPNTLLMAYAGVYITGGSVNALKLGSISTGTGGVYPTNPCKVPSGSNINARAVFTSTSASMPTTITGLTVSNVNNEIYWVALY